MSEFFRQNISSGQLARRAAVVALERMVESLKEHADQKRGPKRFTPVQVQEACDRVLDSWTWEE